MDYTGNIRYITRKRLFRESIDVLQVEVREWHYDHHDCEGTQVSIWRDATSADLRNLKMLLDYSNGIEVPLPSKISLPSQYAV